MFDQKSWRLPIYGMLLFCFVAKGENSFVEKSPDGNLGVSLFVDEDSVLRYNIRFQDTPVLDDSRMGIVVDGNDLGRNVEMGQITRSNIHEIYPWYGKKSEIQNRYRALKISMSQTGSGEKWVLEARIYNDGFAYRYVVPGSDARIVNGEMSEWVLPAKSEVWFQTNTLNYEGVYKKNFPKRIEKNTSMGLPATVELPQGGYTAITEGGLFNYSGMTLKTTGSHRLRSAFEDDPEGWKIKGQIRSPWRITMYASDLNGLVNCDLVANVCPPPDKHLFPNGLCEEWIRPGRSVWSWWSERTGTMERQKWYVDKAAELGFEYSLVDGGWERWEEAGRDKWDLLQELVDYATQRNVKIFVWRYWKSRPERNLNGVSDPADREDLFRRCHEMRIAGVKIDFMDSESKDRINFYTDVLRDAAKYQLMVNFHGANKPTGETRTWPNEITVEAIYGLENNRWWRTKPDRPPLDHYTSLPFTRMLAGFADYTPVTFDDRALCGTSYTLQLATAVIFTSPIVHWADNPEKYLESPALDLIKKMPVVWDETVALPGCKIGDLAAFAKRKGNVWWVAIMNSGQERTLELDLSFLGKGNYGVHYAKDEKGRLDSMIVERSRVHDSGAMSISLNQGGGFVGHFYPLPSSKRFQWMHLNWLR